jgi:hypothetical protein
MGAARGPGAGDPLRTVRGPLRSLRDAASRLRVLRSPGTGAPHVFAPELDVTYRPRNSRRPVLVQVSGGVVAASGQNGHLELRVGRGADPQLIAGVIATRNETDASGRIASGGQLTAIVAPGLSYRLATYTVEGYERPEFVITTLLSETPL